LLLRRAPPELRLVYLLKALDSYGYFALSEVFTTYFSEFGVSDVAAGTYYGAWGTAITAYGVATGFAIDAMGVRRSLVACYALQTLARLILAFTTDPQVAVVTLFTIQALASSWGAPVMAIAIKRIVHDDDRVVSFGIFYSVMNVSALLSGVAIDVLRLAVPNSVFIDSASRAPYEAWWYRR
jgi:MFS family permease